MNNLPKVPDIIVEWCNEYKDCTLEELVDAHNELASIVAKNAGRLTGHERKLSIVDYYINERISANN